MAALPAYSQKLTEAEYLALEQRTGIRHEMIDGHAYPMTDGNIGDGIYAMVGGSFNHGRLSGNLFAEIRQHLKAKPCQVFIENIKVKVNTQGETRYFYPDVVVDCSIDQAEGNILTTPVLIVEVLSHSTRKFDETTKFQSYANIATLQEYLLVDQYSAKIELQRRRSNWAIEKYFLGEQIYFESIDLALTVEDIYDKVDNEEMQAWRSEQHAVRQQLNSAD